MGRAKKEENQVGIEEVVNVPEEDTGIENKAKKVAENDSTNAIPTEEVKEKAKDKKADDKDVARAKATKIIEKAKESGKITYGELANQLEDISPDQSIKYLMYLKN